MPAEFAYIGTWDLGKGRDVPALTICVRDPQSGALRPIGSAIDGVSVGAMFFDQRRGVLYCTDEDTRHGAYLLGGGGRVCAFSVDPVTGDLRELDHRPSYGTLPSDVAVDVSGTYLVVTNHTTAVPATKIVMDEEGRPQISLDYDDATTVLFRLDQNGGIREALDVHIHDGTGGARREQTHPQPHSVTMAPSGDFFVVCDKGDDRILTFRIDRERDRLQALNGAGHVAPPGSSPRYSAFHPTRPLLFVNHEAEPIISTFSYLDGGSLELLHTVRVLPEDVTDLEGVRQSDIRCHPTGGFVYTLIRGADCISVLRLGHAGELTLVQTVPAGGASPRGCAISSDGRFFYVAASGSDRVTTWEVGDDGLLTPTASPVDVPTPGSVVLISGDQGS